MNHATLLIGPQAIGKTRMAQAMRNAIGATTVLDDWNGEALHAGALAITNDDSAASRTPDGTVIYRVGSSEELRRLLTTLSPICRECQHYAGRMIYSLDAGCSHPINTEWNCIDGEHLPAVDCKDMRAADGACGPTGRLFIKGPDVRITRVQRALEKISKLAQTTPQVTNTGA